MDDQIIRHKGRTKIETRGLNLYYGTFQALRNVTMDIEERSITAIIGPSGCGKSSLLRLFNRMNDLIPGVRVEGKINLDGVSIYDKTMDVVELRQKVGMVFQKPNTFPMTIYDNIIFGPKHLGQKSKKELDQIVERNLREVALWDEVKDKLNQPAFELAAGEQQRLCIARALAVKPKMMLFDEPTSALDPELRHEVLTVMKNLAEEGMTMVIVTHEVDFARKAASRLIFIDQGTIAEDGDPISLISNPPSPRLREFLQHVS